MTSTGKNHRLCNQMNYARFYFLEIFELNMDCVKKAIYLDVDMIVQSDIQMLYDYEVNDSVPIQTPYHPKLYRLSGHMLFKKATEYYKHLHALGIADEVVRAKEGFNAGIYLYDLHFWRNNNLTKKYEYYVKLNHEYDGQLWLHGTPFVPYIFHDILPSYIPILHTTAPYAQFCCISG
eukprot:856884_1